MPKDKNKPRKGGFARNRKAGSKVTAHQPGQAVTTVRVAHPGSLLYVMRAGQARRQLAKINKEVTRAEQQLQQLPGSSEVRVERGGAQTG